MLISASPTAGFRYQIKKNQQTIDPFTCEERDAILGALTGNAKVFFAIRFFCGMRPGEVIALTWDDYDGDAFSVSKQIVEQRKQDATKTGRSRKVYAPPPTSRRCSGKRPPGFEGRTSC